jgi:hypothetical protein
MGGVGKTGGDGGDGAAFCCVTIAQESVLVLWVSSMEFSRARVELGREVRVGASDGVDGMANALVCRWLGLIYAVWA